MISPDKSTEPIPEYMDEKTGEHCVSEVLFFTDENEFTAERDLRKIVSLLTGEAEEAEHLNRVQR